MIRAASTPALRALSRPTAATGTPGGICSTERIASRPPSAERRLESGTPITGRSVWAATTPGSAAERPAPAISTRRPARARGARVLGDLVGLAVGRDARGSRGRCRACRARSAAASHRLHVALGAHQDPDEQRPAAGLRRRPRRAVARRSRAARRPRARRCRCAAGVRRTRSCRAAAYAAARAEAGSAPSAVTFSTRPPAVTSAPSRSAVPAWVTSTSAGTRSRPLITIAARARLRVAGAGEHDADRPLRRPLERDAGEAAGARASRAAPRAGRSAAAAAAPASPGRRSGR